MVCAFNQKTEKTKRIIFDTKEASIAGFQAPLFMADSFGQGSLPRESFHHSRKPTPKTPTNLPTATGRISSSCHILGLKTSCSQVSAGSLESSSPRAFRAKPCGTTCSSKEFCSWVIIMVKSLYHRINFLLCDPHIIYK